MIKDAKITGIWGRRGTGKSTCVKKLIKTIDRFIVYDPLYEYDKENCKVVSSIKQMLILIKKGWTKGFKIAYQPETGTDHIENIAEICKYLLKVQQPYKDERIDKKITLIVEEMSLSVPNRNEPRIKTFLDTCNIGRHYGIEIIGTSQRLAEVHTTFRSNAIENYFFALGAAVDIDAAAKIIGKDNAQKLISAPVHCGLYFNNGNITAFKNNNL